ncbi:efflux RND transporter periplasmic adaptor subunit [Thermoflexus sp.]|uniref:efflux RND transporter periplasmic adaptor subunit n=1 Tax=Thermoflexus sp. TaxID=1969742 RepID=UPI002ADD8517|nr:efflux RND transporter periplasmic adaptor subunit [Thermoflexus sp.]
MRAFVMKRPSGVVMVLLMILVVATACARSSEAQSGQGQSTVYRVRRDTLEVYVSGSGNLQPHTLVDLSFPQSGVVRKVYVQVGDSVKAGQVLAELDTRDLELQLQNAQINLKIAQARLAQAQATARSRPADLAAAQAALANAQASLEALKAGPDPRDLEIARLNYEVSKNALWQAQLSRDKTAGMPGSAQVDLQLAQARVGQAELQIEIARLQYEKAQSGPSDQQLKAAEAALAQARDNLIRLQAQDPSLDIQLAQYQVEQAEIAVRQLQLRLEQARLVAPVDGVVTAVNVVEGGPAGTGGPAITLADLNRLEVVVNLPEVDVAQVTVGQEATITPEAMPDTRLRGKVVAIAPVGVQSQGVVNFPVTISLEEASPSVRAGMTVQVQITVARRENALVVPRRALVTRGGQTFVTVLRGDQTEQIPVRVGLRGDTMVEVLDGLQEGDVVVLPASAASAVSTRVPGPGFFGPGMFR